MFNCPALCFLSPLAAGYFSSVRRGCEPTSSLPPCAHFGFAVDALLGEEFQVLVLVKNDGQYRISLTPST